MNSAQADLPQTGANLKPSWVLPIDPLNIPDPIAQPDR